ncbi:DUF4340 domain-containing protein [Nitrospina gracilis]|uniref:DUF4340 domain-containing protein n=1 Tax=Nitrospina gracilis TaxID=35801 RepID=UPI001F172B5F|nr:DUF4340 domain-containing protein [Nitrospina gracilis]MCF8721352.1 hypothetical protein [Nitrospina gracilis Nb-211]
MKFRGTLIWIAVFAALTAYVGLIELPSEKKEQEEKVRAEKLLLFKEGDVEKLMLKRGNTITQIRRLDKDSWQIEEPLQAKASRSAIDQLLYELETARHSRIVEKDPADLAPFGLDSPPLVITLHLKSGKTLSLELGNASPIGHSHYVKVGDAKAVYLSELDARIIDKSANDLRDRSLFSFSTADVQRFTLRYREETQTVSKEKETWQLSGKVNGLADSDEVLDFLSALQSADAVEFIDETPDALDIYGLTSPRIVLTADLKGKDDKPGRTLTLRVGNEHKKGQYYAQLSETGNVFTIAQHLVTTLSRNAITFLDKKLLTFEEKEIASITLKSEEETVVLQRQDGNKEKGESAWVLIQPENEAVNPAAVNSLLFDLKDVRVKEFVEAERLDLFGLKNSTQVVTVQAEGGQTVSIRLGNSNMQKDLYFAQRTSDNAVFALSAEDVGKIFRSLHDLRNRKLFSIDAEKAGRIVLEYPDQTFELIRNNGGKWSLVQPENIESVPDHIVRGIVWTLNNLEYESQGTPEKSNNGMGLESPALRLSVESADRKPLARLTVGNLLPNEDRRYAQVKGQSAWYSIKNRFLDEIPASVERFRAKAS